MDIHTLQTTVRDFAAVRGWPRFHTPKNLAMALMVEAAELMEIFQWLTPDESSAAASDPARKQHIGEEIADVQIYLLQMAEQTRVDLGAAVLDKLQSNARRYPAPDGATDVALPALPVAEQPVTHVLVDYENVQPSDEQVRALVPQAARLWVFHGPHQKELAARFASFGNGLTVVPISKSGKNALDFHLSFYMGYIAARNPQARFVVMANDKGYEPMLEHARQLHFDVQTIGLPRGRKAAATTRSTTPRKKATRTPAKKAASAKPVPVKHAAQPSAARKVAVKTATRARAGTSTRLDVKPDATSHAKAATKAALKAAPKAAPKANPKTPAKTTAIAKPEAAVKASPKASATPVVKLVATRATAPAHAAPAKQPAARHKAAPAATTATKPGLSAALITKVEQGLRRLDDQRLPGRLARLRGVLKSLLGSDADAGTIDAALAHLQARRLVSVDAGGAVSYPAAGASR